MLPVSVCIIVKNEGERIERCLSSLTPYGLELVVVDTGSADGTKAAALRYTDRVFDFVWINDFSAARNYSLSLASNDWVFIIDSDEWVEELDTEELVWFMKNLPAAAGSVSRKNIAGTTDHLEFYTDRTERFFNRRLYRYTGTIHEQLTPLDENPFDSFLLNTVLLHDGYQMTAEQRQKKAERNIFLLLEQIKKEPDNPYLHYQLGKGYEMIGDNTNACECYRNGMAANPDPSLAWVQSMVISYGYSLLRSGASEAALAFRNIRPMFSQSADFLYLLGLIYMQNGYPSDALEEFRKAVTFDFANENGVNSFLSYYQMGNIYLLAGDRQTAAQCYAECGEYAPAKEALSRLEEPQ